MSYSKAVILGRVGKIEMKYTESGMAIANISVASSEKRKDKDEITHWHHVVVFKKQAENCEKYLEVGQQVLVDGNLGYDTWDDPDGKKQYKTRIIANNIQFLGEKKSGNEAKTNTNTVTDAQKVASDLPF